MAIQKDVFVKATSRVFRRTLSLSCQKDQAFRMLGLAVPLQFASVTTSSTCNSQKFVLAFAMRGAFIPIRGGLDLGLQVSQSFPTGPSDSYLKTVHLVRILEPQS